MTGQDKAGRKRATRAERAMRLRAQLLEIEAQEKKAKKAEDWKNIRVMAYALASLVQYFKDVIKKEDSFGNMAKMIQRSLNKRDRARLVTALDQLGVKVEMYHEEQVPLALCDCGWCRSPVLKEVSPPSPPAPPAGAGGETTK